MSNDNNDDRITRKFGWENPQEAIAEGHKMAEAISQIPMLGLDVKVLNSTIEVGFKGDRHALIAGVLVGGPAIPLEVDTESPVGFATRPSAGESQFPLAVQMHMTVEQITALINMLIATVDEMESIDPEVMIAQALDSLAGAVGADFDPDTVNWEA